MCGGKVAKTDPEADAQVAADKAVVETNRKKALRNQANTDSVLASADPKAKTTLGGG